MVDLREERLTGAGLWLGGLGQQINALAFGGGGGLISGGTHVTLIQVPRSHVPPDKMVRVLYQALAANHSSGGRSPM